ncbi:MAG: radical SAM protein, partial [Armatimonadota bacterium]
MLHPAPPQSHTIFMAGCNFRCLHCQNWDIAHWPDSNAEVDGEVAADALARESLAALRSLEGRLIRADRLFFSGGEATCSLPFVEEVVREARRMAPETKVNFDTNGFMTEESLDRVLALATSMTF